MDNRQKELFERIHEKYYLSTGDKYARAYKEEYILRAMNALLQDSSEILELACGQGEATGWIIQNNPLAKISGCDISETAAADYRYLHSRPCLVADLTKPVHVEDRYDSLIVMGGIHHLVKDLDVAFENFRRLLKPGGRLIMAEPSSDYILNPIRRIWYRLDKSHFDSSTEAAISHEKLHREHGKGFSIVHVNYFGGPAYFLLTLNIFLRIPNGSKQFLAPPLLAIERLFNRLPGKLPFAAFVSCWEMNRE